jgi:glycine cleavage system protein P-like pyridoxal-binding family
MAAAPFGSALILPISYAFIALMGSHGLRQSSEYAILKVRGQIKTHTGAQQDGNHGSVQSVFLRAQHDGKTQVSSPAPLMGCLLCLF